ncbi:MAG: transcription antitermination factor NusB [Elusimicrobia bacterium RIFOXYD12_FULL_66_9]|nr:MAG: transcription antitermination factor NusB [Elusimicrobia bacterium RIFOXYD12_FULL_66_9]
MGRRRLAREVALQALYVADVSRTPAEEAFAVVTRRDGEEIDEQTMIFARELTLGTLARVEELDEIIQKNAQNWAVNRMAAVDRNVIRLAAYELTARPDTPVGVIIDEAIEIVRKYSTEEATRFVNGVLDALKSLRDGKKKA